MNRPTITLCCIMKDEISHIKDLLASVNGCFDEIHLTDTGSSDGTVEFARSEEAEKLAGCPVKLKYFTWINDFAAARNFSMNEVTTDYVMWMDLDDVLSSREEFIRFRDNVMLLNDFWLAPYHYASDEKGRPIISFLRERVVKTKKKFSWKYFIHEGMLAEEPVNAQVCHNWQIIHKRTEEDYKKDYERNVSMLEERSKRGEELPPRLQWYFGKELHDKGRFAEAYTWLDRVCTHPSLELHDRILSFEYLVRTCLQRFFIEEFHKPQHQRDLRILVKAHQIALQGMVLSPTRAEFFCLAGDCLVHIGKEIEAMPMYAAAMNCVKPSGTQPGFIFINHACYDHLPRNQVAMLKYKMGNLDGAIFDLTECYKKFENKETQALLTQMLNLKNKMDQHATTIKAESDAIVFSCIPNSHPYPFDEEIYETKGVGGSETALIEVARHMKKITGRPVIVFNTRESAKVCKSGVEYRPAHEMYEYFTKFKPDLHIAWRHNIKLTDAKTFLWCHDLYTPGAEQSHIYEKHICLSPFHKNYVQIQQGIPDRKIHISRNGVNADRFEGIDKEKDPNKIIWPNSPDRGLIEAIQILDEARKMSLRDLELHVFYGIENLYKYGRAELADTLKKMFQERPWIHYHGNVDQKTLAKEMSTSAIWLYCADFIETYCITAVEAAMAGCYSIVREVGALRDTMKPFVEAGKGELLFREAKTEEDRRFWAERVVQALDQKKWEKKSWFNVYDYSWEGVAEDFLILSELRDTQQNREIVEHTRI